MYVVIIILFTINWGNYISVLPFFNLVFHGIELGSIVLKKNTSLVGSTHKHVGLVDVVLKLENCFSVHNEFPYFRFTILQYREPQIK